MELTVADADAEIVTRARRLLRALARRLPFLGALAHRAEVLADPAVAAAAVDVEAVRIALRPSWAAALDDDELAFVLAHELMHVFLGSGTRGRGAEPFVWNLAHDAVINRELRRLLGRPPPHGGIELDAGDDADAEAVYLRRDLERMRSWLDDPWQVDLHRDASPALAAARAGDGMRLAVGGELVAYTREDYDADRDVAVHAARIEVAPVRPWPASWLDAAPQAGERARAWRRASRRQDGRERAEPLRPGRAPAGRGELVALVDGTPRAVATLARRLGMLRAFAEDAGVAALRLIACAADGVAADVTVATAAWDHLSLPDTLANLRVDGARWRGGLLVCSGCGQPHAAVRPDPRPPAFDAVPRALRAGAIVIEGAP